MEQDLAPRSLSKMIKRSIPASDKMNIHNRQDKIINMKQEIMAYHPTKLDL